MQKPSRLVLAASAAALVLLPAVALAQGAPDGGTAATATPFPAAPAPEAAAAEKEKAAPKKKKPARMTRQQEIDRSIDRGTVPARYRSSVPKEYHQYIPFDKR
ncbi:hypothetical protein [Bradyrhizobium sp. sGM-13]|uniref:hypothetical protein n=1 Tax=Bradyrhizobium sp. sGM-13 TaxID=2831781 RepID=UPI001BCDF347|nr:hypothetical protein [Bradyrhizobium sp. sGM-13]